MIRKILIGCLWLMFSLLMFLVPFAYIPAMYVSSGTEIKIDNVKQEDYNQMKKSVKVLITNLNPPFNCEFDKKYWKANRDSGELICQDHNFNELYMKKEKENISIYYSGSSSFLIPSRMIITEEHVRLQKLFLELASRYKMKYEKVQVIFYHRDLPKEGKVLL